MAGEQNPGSGAPTGAAGSGVGTSVAGGNAGSTGGAGAGSVGGSGAGGLAPQGGAPPQQVVSVNVLPPEFQGKSEAELKFLLSNMASGYKSLTNEKATLERQLREKATSPPPPPAEPKAPKKPLEERILEDPEGAIREVVESLYGSTVSEMGTEIADSVYRDMRREHSDFKDVEDDVKQILVDAGAPSTRHNLNLAYETVVGRRAIENRRQQQAASLNSDAPPRDGAGSTGVATPAQGTLEHQIWQASGMSVEDWNKYKNDDFDIKVPTGRKA